MAAGRDPVGNPRRMASADLAEFIRQNQEKGKGGTRPWGEAQQAAQDSALEALAAPFDILAWLKNNWRAALIIAVCLLILTR